MPSGTASRWPEPWASPSTAAKSAEAEPRVLWKTIMANVLNIQLDVPEAEQGPGMGGAMLAMVACGRYPSVAAACEALVRTAETISPDPELAARYEVRYQQFKAVYPALKDVFAAMNGAQL